jgi:predicted acetyltransferase
VTVPPGDLDAPAPEPAGEFRRCTADDWETLDAVHRAAATEPLAMRRTEGWWRHRVLESWETDPYAVAWLDDAGVPRGYLVYTVEGDAADDRTLRASDLAAADHGALRHLLRFCRDHDSQVAEVEFEARPDVATGLFELLSDPRAATVELRPGPMLRAVDVRAAVEALAVPAGVEERVTLAVDDETCPWNAGTYELRVADAAARLRPATDAEPALSVGVDALAGVLVGAVGPTRLVETGAATGDAAAAAALERAFPPAPRTPWLREFF